MIDRDPLLQWLRDELRRPDLAATLEGLLADSTLDADLRMLHFVHEVWPQAPAVWRGRTLSAEAIDEAAASAVQHSAHDALWLQSLIDSRVWAFHGARGRNDLAELGARWTEARTQYDATWDAVIAAGGPQSARPSPAEALAISARACFCEPYRTVLTQRSRLLLNPTQWLRRELWFTQFGSDVANMPMARLAVLDRLGNEASVTRQLLPHSLDMLHTLSQPEREAMRQGLVLSRLTEQLACNLMLRPGVPPLTLLPGDRHYPAESWSWSRQLLILFERGVAAASRIAARAWRAGQTWRRNRQAAANRASQAPGQPPAANPAPAPQTAPNVTFQVLAQPVELVVDSLQAGVPVMQVVIAWAAPDSRWVQIAVARRGGFWPSVTLRLRALPSQGQVVLLVEGSARFKLRHRDATLPWYRALWPGRWTRMPPIDIWLPVPATLHEGEKEKSAMQPGTLKLNSLGSELQSPGPMQALAPGGVAAMRVAAPTVALRTADAVALRRGADMTQLRRGEMPMNVARSTTSRERLLVGAFAGSIQQHSVRRSLDVFLCRMASGRWFAQAPWVVLRRTKLHRGRHLRPDPLATPSRSIRRLA